MDNIFSALKLGFSAAGGFLAYWLGGLDKLLYALIAFMVLDYLTGLLSAWVRKEVSSETGFRGILKKVLLLGVVAVAYVIEDITGGALPLREVTIMFFVANEGLSILENAARSGLPMPRKLREVLCQVKEEQDEPASDTADQ